MAIYLICRYLWHGWAIDTSYKSHNASEIYPIMQYFVTEMCTFLLQIGACGIWDWCIVGFVQQVHNTPWWVEMYLWYPSRNVCLYTGYNSIPHFSITPSINPWCHVCLSLHQTLLSFIFLHIYHEIQHCCLQQAIIIRYGFLTPGS